MKAPRQKPRLRRRKKRGTERGIALVMVMGAIAILTVMLAEFQDETSAELAAATAQRDGIQAEYSARSALNLSRLLIASEPTMRKAIAPLFMLMKRSPPQLPLWEFSDRMLGIFNDPESSQGSASSLGIDPTQGKNLGLPNGAWELSIVDEDSKINMNLGAANEIAHIRLAKEIMGLLAPIQYDPLFNQRDGAGQYNDRFQTCAAIIDWADVDEQGFNCNMQQMTAAAAAGIEDNYYASIQPKGYRRKNAPYDSLAELHMVRGVSEDFWATFIDPAPEDPKKRVVTVWGQGAINVNTANAQTLLAVVCSGAVPTAPLCNDPMQQQTFLTAVTMARGMTMGAPLFGSPKDFVQAMTGAGQLGTLLAALGLQNVQFHSSSEFQKSITTESKMFSVYAVGIKKGYRRETRVKIHAVLDFRNAPALGSTMTGMPGMTTPGAAMPGMTGAMPGMTGATTNPADALAAANMPSTGGQVLYYKVE
ncbi:MAG: general secretion pathway protein GspK [Labilithrix sp.]|nr:general secretion pathway protein GspK [Labilithrix sp.]MCW5813565.1 general secretion pathway protein GspK [Labilithrix sp.]